MNILDGLINLLVGGLGNLAVALWLADRRNKSGAVPTR